MADNWTFRTETYRGFYIETTYLDRRFKLARVRPNENLSSTKSTTDLKRIIDKYINTKLKELKSWMRSDYNEDTEDELNYYVNGTNLNVGATAYMYNHEDNSLTEMTIINFIARSDDADEYDDLLEDDNILVEYEDKYNADTSCEFITDDDCCMVWFKYN